MADKEEKLGPTEIAYIDESYDTDKFCMSTLILSTHQWRECFEIVKEWRRELRKEHGIFTNKEFHATKFVSGRGRLGHRDVPKALRAQIFLDAMDLIGSLPGAAIISGAWDVASLDDPNAHAFQRIQERLQRRCTGQAGYIVTIADEGRATELLRVSRRSKVYNPVGSMFGMWGDGSVSKNIPNERLIEDPVFRNSAQSYFLQLVDFVAFALLKSEVTPTPLVTKYGLHEAYDRLEPVCVKVATGRDPRKLGIIRT